MPNTPVGQIRLQGWRGGLNTEADDVTIAADELGEATNIKLGINGELEKRKGYAKYSASEHANMGEGRFLFHWDQLGSANDFFILVDADGDVFSSSTTSFASAAAFDITAHTGDDDYPVAGVAYDNVFYLTSLRANGRSFDGTTWTEITDYELDNDGTGTEFPRASSLVVKHERLFASNINNNGTRERSRIRWSEVGDATAWGSTSWIDVDPDDGSEIRKIIGFADGVVIMKDRSTFFLSGVDANSFTLFPVDSTIGTQSPGTVVATESAVFFLDDTRGVYSFDGTAMERISDKVNDQLLTDASIANNKFHKGFYFREKYYLSLHDGTDKNVTYVYDTRNQAWARWTNGWYDAAETGGAMYVTGATDDTGTVTTGICTYLSGETDNGETFEAKARTGWIAPEDSGFSQQRFRIRSVDVVAVEGSGTLTVNLYEDFKTSTSVSGSASMDNDNYDHVYRRVNFTPALQSGRQTFQLEFVLDSATATFIIPAVEVQISPRRRQRGAANF